MPCQSCTWQRDGNLAQRKREREINICAPQCERDTYICMYVHAYYCRHRRHHRRRCGPKRNDDHQPFARYRNRVDVLRNLRGIACGRRTGAQREPSRLVVYSGCHSTGRKYQALWNEKRCGRTSTFEIFFTPKKDFYFIIVSPEINKNLREIWEFYSKINVHIVWIGRCKNN